MSLKASSPLTRERDETPQASPDNTNSLGFHSIIVERKLASLTNLKRGSLRTAKALLSPRLSVTSTESGILMASCAQRLYRDNNGTLRALTRCKLKTCAYCAHIRGSQAVSRLRSALGYLRTPLIKDAHQSTPERLQAKAIKVTLNTGEACTLDELGARLDILHLAWRQLLMTSRIKEEMHGSMRSTEITPSSEDRANPHIHGFLLVRASSSMTELINLITKRWRSILKRLLSKAGMSDVTVVASVGAIEELTEQTSEDLLSWVSYMTKGSFDLDKHHHRELHKTASPEYWSIVTEQTRHRRLISASGDVRDALAKAKQELRDHRRDSWSRPTLTIAVEWCDESNSYQDPDDIQPGPPYKLTHSVSYAERHDGLGLIFIAEHSKALHQQRLRAISLMAHNGLLSMAIKAKETDKSLITQERPHWSEPPEIKRAPPSSPRNANAPKPSERTDPTTSKVFTPDGEPIGTLSEHDPEHFNSDSEDEPSEAKQTP